MSKLFARFVKDESGATAIEYGLIAALIALAIMVGASSLGNSINNKFKNLGTTLDNALRWGRWSGRNLTFNAQTSLYKDIPFMTGIVATDVPTSGPVGVYNLAGATIPVVTGLPALTGSAVTAAQLQVDFTQSKFDMKWDLKVYETVSSGWLVNAWVQGRLGGTQPGQPTDRWFFWGDPSTGTSATSTARACTSACTSGGTPQTVNATVNGFLAGSGPGGTAAGVVYRVDLPGGSPSIPHAAVGAIGLTK